MKVEIEEYCKEYLDEIREFRRLITLLSCDLDNIDLQVELLKLHYDIIETRKEIRRRLL